MELHFVPVLNLLLFFVLQLSSSIDSLLVNRSLIYPANYDENYLKGEIDVDTSLRVDANVVFEHVEGYDYDDRAANSPVQPCTILDSLQSTWKQIRLRLDEFVLVETTPTGRLLCNLHSNVSVKGATIVSLKYLRPSHYAVIVETTWSNRVTKTPLPNAVVGTVRSCHAFYSKTGRNELVLVLDTVLLTNFRVLVWSSTSSKCISFEHHFQDLMVVDDSSTVLLATQRKAGGRIEVSVWNWSLKEKDFLKFQTLKQSYPLVVSRFVPFSRQLVVSSSAAAMNRETSLVSLYAFDAFETRFSALSSTIVNVDSATMVVGHHRHETIVLFLTTNGNLVIINYENGRDSSLTTVLNVFISEAASKLFLLQFSDHLLVAVVKPHSVNFYDYNGLNDMGKMTIKHVSDLQAISERSVDYLFVQTKGDDECFFGGLSVYRSSIPDDGLRSYVCDANEESKRERTTTRRTASSRFPQVSPLDRLLCRGPDCRVEAKPAQPGIGEEPLPAFHTEASKAIVKGDREEPSAGSDCDEDNEVEDVTVEAMLIDEDVDVYASTITLKEFERGVDAFTEHTTDLRGASMDTSLDISTWTPAFLDDGRDERIEVYSTVFHVDLLHEHNEEDMSTLATAEQSGIDDELRMSSVGEVSSVGDDKTLGLFSTLETMLGGREETEYQISTDEQQTTTSTYERLLAATTDEYHSEREELHIVDGSHLPMTPEMLATPHRTDYPDEFDASSSSSSFSVAGVLRYEHSQLLPSTVADVLDVEVDEKSWINEVSTVVEVYGAEDGDIPFSTSAYESSFAPEVVTHEEQLTAIPSVDASVISKEEKDDDDDDHLQSMYISTTSTRDVEVEDDDDAVQYSTASLAESERDRRVFELSTVDKEMFEHHTAEEKRVPYATSTKFSRLLLDERLMLELSTFSAGTHHRDSSVYVADNTPDEFVELSTIRVKDERVEEVSTVVAAADGVKEEWMPLVDASTHAAPSAGLKRFFGEGGFSSVSDREEADEAVTASPFEQYFHHRGSSPISPLRPYEVDDVKFSTVDDAIDEDYENDEELELSTTVSRPMFQVDSSTVSTHHLPTDVADRFDASTVVIVESFDFDEHRDEESTTLHDPDIQTVPEVERSAAEASTWFYEEVHFDLRPPQLTTVVESDEQSTFGDRSEEDVASTVLIEDEERLDDEAASTIRGVDGYHHLFESISEVMTMTTTIEARRPKVSDLDDHSTTYMAAAAAAAADVDQETEPSTVLPEWIYSEHVDFIGSTVLVSDTNDAEVVDRSTVSNVFVDVIQPELRKLSIETVTMSIEDDDELHQIPFELSTRMEDDEDRQESVTMESSSVIELHASELGEQFTESPSSEAMIIFREEQHRQSTASEDKREPLDFVDASTVVAFEQQQQDVLHSTVMDDVDRLSITDEAIVEYSTVFNEDPLFADDSLDSSTPHTRMETDDDLWRVSTVVDEIRLSAAAAEEYVDASSTVTAIRERPIDEERSSTVTADTEAEEEEEYFVAHHFSTVSADEERVVDPDEDEEEEEVMYSTSSAAVLMNEVDVDAPKPSTTPFVDTIRPDDDDDDDERIRPSTEEAMAAEDEVHFPSSLSSVVTGRDDSPAGRRVPSTPITVQVDFEDDRLYGMLLTSTDGRRRIRVEESEAHPDELFTTTIAEYDASRDEGGFPIMSTVVFEIGHRKEGSLLMPSTLVHTPEEEDVDAAAAPSTVITVDVIADRQLQLASSTMTSDLQHPTEPHEHRSVEIATDAAIHEKHVPTTTTGRTALHHRSTPVQGGVAPIDDSEVLLVIGDAAKGSSAIKTTITTTSSSSSSRKSSSVPPSFYPSVGIKAGIEPAAEITCNNETRSSCHLIDGCEPEAEEIIDVKDDSIECDDSRTDQSMTAITELVGNDDDDYEDDGEFTATAGTTIFDQVDVHTDWSPPSEWRQSTSVVSTTEFYDDVDQRDCCT